VIDLRLSKCAIPSLSTLILLTAVDADAAPPMWKVIKARSTITCDARYGVCASCYGNDMARGHKIGVGEAGGVIAADVSTVYLYIVHSTYTILLYPTIRSPYHFVKFFVLFSYLNEYSHKEIGVSGENHRPVASH
jgi:hypothetical protein